MILESSLDEIPKSFKHSKHILDQIFSKTTVIKDLTK